MFSQGSLLYITDFDFSTLEGSLSKINNFRDKYILVLDNLGENISIFCCFTTTLRQEKNFHQDAEVGCNKDYFPYNVFHFEPYIGVTDKNFIFPSKTFIAGNKGQVFEYDLPKLYKNYKLNNQIHHKGNLNKQLLFDIIHCLHNSRTLENDIKQELFEIGDTLMNAIQKEQEE